MIAATVEAPELALEIGQVGEVLVDAGKTHRRNLIAFSEPFQNRVTYRIGADLAPSEPKPLLELE